MKKFKHEGKNYEPFGDQSGTYERPWWVKDDTVMLRDEKYKKEGRI